MLPRTTSKSNDPLAVNTRLKTILSSLQAERATLIAQFRSLQESSNSTDPDVSTTQQKSSTGAEAEGKTAELESSAEGQKLSEIEDTKVLEEAKKVVKRHIKLLHDYNGVRDVGQGLMGMIAEQRGVRIVDVMEERGVGVND